MRYYSIREDRFGHEKLVATNDLSVAVMRAELWARRYAYCRLGELQVTVTATRWPETASISVPPLEA